MLISTTLHSGRGLGFDPTQNVNKTLYSQLSLLQSKRNGTFPSIESKVATQPEQTLLGAIEQGTFWTMSDRDLLYLVKAEYPEELQHLKHAYSVRSCGWREMPESPSRILYPNEPVYDEINRSLVGVLALRWLNDNHYDKFTCNQPPAVRLGRESFDWIRNIFSQQNILGSHTYKVYALVTSMIANDLGKSATFIRAYEAATVNVACHDNHDMVLHKAVQKQLVPVVERLQFDTRNEVKRGVKLGAEFNVGQLAQAENAPAALAPLLELVGHENAWNMRWMEQILDIAGAAGHEDHSCAKKLIEPIFRSYRSVYDIVIGIVQGKTSLRGGYDQNLTTRYQLILNSGWQPPRPLSVQNSEDRALMRIFCMGNVANPSSADLYYHAFYSEYLDTSTRQELVTGLNRDGTVEEPAVQPTYCPAMLSLALSTSNHTSQDKSTLSHTENTSQILVAMLRYLARTLNKPIDPHILKQKNVTVVERDMRVAIKDVIESSRFKDGDWDRCLDEAEVAVDGVANRVVL